MNNNQETIYCVWCVIQEFRSQCTHVILGKLSRSEKYLCVCATGKWALHPEYVDDSMTAGEFLDEEQYEWCDNRFRPTSHGTQTGRFLPTSHSRHTGRFLPTSHCRHTGRFLPTSHSRHTGRFLPMSHCRHTSRFCPHHMVVTLADSCPRHTVGTLADSCQCHMVDTLVYSAHITP